MSEKRHVKDTPTPVTDEATDRCDNCHIKFVMTECAEFLERDRDRLFKACFDALAALNMNRGFFNGPQRICADILRKATEPSVDVPQEPAYEQQPNDTFTRVDPTDAGIATLANKR